MAKDGPVVAHGVNNAQANSRIQGGKINKVAKVQLVAADFDEPDGQNKRLILAVIDGEQVRALNTSAVNVAQWLEDGVLDALPTKGKKKSGKEPKQA